MLRAAIEHLETLVREAWNTARLAYASYAGLVAANEAAAIALNLTDGKSVFVLTERAWWVMKTGTPGVTAPALKANEVIATSGGVLCRTSYSDLAWRSHIAHVYIDPINGDDENQGIYTTAPASPAPLKTAQELARRWGYKNVITSDPVSFETTIHVRGAIAAPDRLDLTWIAGLNSFFRILGESTTQLHGGTLDVGAGFTAWNPTGALGGSPTIIKDSAVASFAPWIGKRIHFPRVNSWAYILKDLGGNQASISAPQRSDEASFAVVPANVFPASGDTYVIEDPVHVALGATDLDGVYDQAGTFGPASGLNIADITFTLEAVHSNTMILKTSPALAIALYQCCVEGSYLNAPEADSVTFGNCRVWRLTEESVAQTGAGGLAYFGGAIVWPGGVSISNVSGGLGDAGVLDYYTSIQHGYVIIHGNSQIRSISVWDATGLGDNPNGHGILVGTPGHHATAGAVRIMARGVVPVFGAGNAGVGLFVGAASTAIWEVVGGAPPNIYGAAGQFKLGSGGKARFFDEGLGLPSAVLPETWAAIAAAQPAGFGGNAHNYTDESHLLQSFAA